MSDQVTSTFTANTSSLEASLQSVLDRVQRLETATSKTGDQLDKFSDKGHKAAEGAEHAGSAAEGLAGHLQALSGHTSIISELFEKLGIDAGGMGKNLGLAGEAVETLGSKIPVLAAVAAAVVAVGVAFMALKEGVAEAGEVDLKLDQIANSAKNAGADFGKSREDVKEWGEALSNQTGAPITQLLAGVQRMVAAHIDLHTAMTLTSDAEKIAIASGRDQTEVETALQQAILGRTRGLVALGIITKDEAKNGISLAEVNERIQKQTEGAVKLYQDSLPGALAITGNQVKELLKDLGEDSGLIGVVVGLLKWVQSVIPAIKQFAEEGLAKAHEAGAALGPVLDDLKPSLERLWNALLGVGGSLLAVADRVGVIVGAIVNFFKPVLDWLGGAVADTFGFVVEIIKGSLDETLAILDGFIALFTGDWSKFNHDLWVLADDGLTALNNLFAGHLADIVGAIEGLFEYAKTKFGNLMKMAADAAAFVANPLQGAVNLAVDYGTAPDLQALIAQHTKAAQGAIDYVHRQAAPPAGAATQIKHGGGGTSGEIKDQEIGGATGGHKGKKAHQPGIGYQPSFQEHLVSATPPVDKKAQEDWEAYFASLTAGEAALEHAVKMATTEQARQAAQLDLTRTKIADLAQEQLVLAHVVSTDTEAVQTAKTAYSDTANAYNLAQQNLYQFQQSLKGKTKLTQDDKDAEKLLQAEVARTKAQHEAAAKTLTQATETLDKHKKKLDETTKSYNKLKESEAEALAQLQYDWNTYWAKSEAKMREDAATFEKTNAQKAAYYKQQLDQFVKWNADGSVTFVGQTKEQLQEAEQLWGQYANAVKGNETDIYNAHKAAVQKMTADITTFLDDVIVQHKSFRDILKGIYDQILQAFIAMVAKMIVESQLFKSIFGNLAGGSSSGFASFFSGLFGSGSAGSQSLLSTVPGFASTTAAANQMILADVGPNAAKILTGSTSGVSPFSPGGAFVNASGGVTFLGALGVAAGAAGVGGLGAKLTGGNTTNGAIGGLVGVAGLVGAQALMTGVGMGPALGALLASGPAGWALLAGAGLLGGIVGGAFGPHLNAQNAPDLFNTASYGQAMANMGGNGGVDWALPYMANGQSFTEDSKLSSELGGHGEIAYIANYLKNNPNAAAAAGLTPDEVADFTGATGETYKAGGYVDLGNGKTVHWDTLAAAADDATQKILALGGSAANATGPIYAITRMAPDFNTARLSQWSNSISDALTSGTTTAPNAPPTPPTPPIQITVNGVIGDRSQIAAFLSEQLRRNQFYNYGNAQAQ